MARPQCNTKLYGTTSVTPPYAQSEMRLPHRFNRRSRQSWIRRLRNHVDASHASIRCDLHRELDQPLFAAPARFLGIDRGGQRGIGRSGGDARLAAVHVAPPGTDTFAPAGSFALLRGRWLGGLCRAGSVMRGGRSPETRPAVTAAHRQSRRPRSILGRRTAISSTTEPLADFPFGSSPPPWNRPEATAVDHPRPPVASPPRRALILSTSCPPDGFRHHPVPAGASAADAGAGRRRPRGGSARHGSRSTRSTKHRRSEAERPEPAGEASHGLPAANDTGQRPGRAIRRRPSRRSDSSCAAPSIEVVGSISSIANW